MCFINKGPKGEAVPQALATNKLREEPDLDHGWHRFMLFFDIQTSTVDGFAKPLKEEAKANYANAAFKMRWMDVVLSQGNKYWMTSLKLPSGRRKGPKCVLYHMFVSNSED